MNRQQACFIDGVGWWTAALPSWTLACRAAADGALSAISSDAPDDGSRPAPTVLAANERRRASDMVLMALEAASQAVQASGLDPATLASVFSSAHGDLVGTDALCRTLADDPLLLSPTRFHQSVHNAASGYWAIAHHCHAASTALSAFDRSFVIGLLEALVHAATEQAPVLLVDCDVQATGTLATVNRSRGKLAVALVISPQRQAASGWKIDWSLRSEVASDADGAVSRRSPSDAWPKAWQGVAANAAADALPLFGALARTAGSLQDTIGLALPTGGSAVLELRVSALRQSPASGAQA
jgi:hypothetical protein